MKVFAYEHITGGGLLGQPGVAALAPEGEWMLRALVHDLAALPDVEVVVMRDPRVTLDLPVAQHVPQSAEELWPTFRRVAREADAVWPIAPEHDGILERVSREILQAERTLLGSRPEAVRTTSSKLRTAALLAAAGIGTIPTFADEESVPDGVHQIVVKPDDGAGCQETRLFLDRTRLRLWLREHRRAAWVFQPFLHGAALSLSVLCRDQRALLLACNRQHISISDERFEFSGVSVNAIADRDGRYARLASAVIRALPGLWGYVGIDVIDTAAGPVVVEVNPRLTTSYAGLRRALGINAARLVLELPGSLEGAFAPIGTATVEVAVEHAS
jgi:predicted ATP-grasp superfamily ATP-dependent carboligase